MKRRKSVPHGNQKTLGQSINYFINHIYPPVKLSSFGEFQFNIWHKGAIYVKATSFESKSKTPGLYNYGLNYSSKNFEGQRTSFNEVYHQSGTLSPGQYIELRDRLILTAIEKLSNLNYSGIENPYEDDWVDKRIVDLNNFCLFSHQFEDWTRNICSPGIESFVKCIN